jgi:hypothetical protein
MLFLFVAVNKDFVLPANDKEALAEQGLILVYFLCFENIIK